MAIGVHEFKPAADLAAAIGGDSAAWTVKADVDFIAIRQQRRVFIPQRTNYGHA
jgi:hypothetical protein